MSLKDNTGNLAIGLRILALLAVFVGVHYAGTMQGYSLAEKELSEDIDAMNQYIWEHGYNSGWNDGVDSTNKYGMECRELMI